VCDIDMITDAAEGEITVVSSESQGLFSCYHQCFSCKVKRWKASFPISFRSLP